MSAALQNLVPSTRRPVPLVGRRDLTEQKIAGPADVYHVIKDPVGLRYFRLEPAQYHALELLDGRRSLEDLRGLLHERLFPQRLSFSEVQAIVVDLHAKGLALGNRPGQGAELVARRRKTRWHEWLSMGRNLLYLRLPGFDPEPILRRLYPLVKWMFGPWGLAMGLTAVIASWVLILVQFESFQRRLPEFGQFFGWPNLIFLWVALAGTKLVHEFGHGLTCRHMGGECHEIGVMLLVFSPTMYCDVSDSWMLASKWQRIAIGAAGMCVEVVLSAFALFVWWFTYPGLLNDLALNVFFVCTITTVIFNANPLLRFDGYFMLSDLLEIPNLGQKASKALLDGVGALCLGIEPRPDPFAPRHGRFWFILYAVASTAYRWSVIAGVTIFLYTVLKPYDLQSVGIAMACLSILGISGGLGANMAGLLKTPRTRPMSRWRIAATLAVAAGVVAVILQLPVPWHVEAPFHIEPRQVQNVYTPVAGEIEQALVEPGQTVAQGQALVRLTDAEKHRRLAELQTDVRLREADVAAMRALDAPPRLAVAEVQLRSARAVLEDFENNLGQLTLAAPVAGTIVAPLAVREPRVDPNSVELPRWYGTPLDPQNVGAFLEPRTWVLSIAPDDRFQAILLVDQADRDDLAVGAEVEIRFDHLPDRTYRGVISDISLRQAEYVPQNLSSRLGGDVPTTTDHRGRERLTSPAYEATVVLVDGTALLRSGIRGRSRFLVGDRTLGQWAWRAIRRTFHFRM